MFIINFIRGFIMSLADSVPGVSGGTIAFILGFYDKFINSLNLIVSKNKEERNEALFFLIKLGIGWITGFILSVLFLSSIFDSHIYMISSLFTGFILFSIPLIIKEERESLAGKYKNIIFTLLGALLVIGISYMNPSSNGNGLNLAIGSLSIKLVIYIFIVGAVAISAMVLPGISGSTLLLIFGLYAPIISSIKEVLSFNFSYLPVLIIFGLGVIFGIVATIRTIRKLLKNSRSKMIYFILGLMIGSFYPVFMGATTLKVPQPAMTLSTFNWIFFIIGGAIILGLEKLKNVISE